MRRDRYAVSWLTDCEKCMQTNPRQARQILGCGYEPPLVELRGRPFKAMPWTPGGYPGDPPTVCAGYTTKLPEVVEVSRARLWLDKHDLRTFTQGEPPSDLLALGIEVLEVEICRHQDVVANRQKGHDRC